MKKCVEISRLKKAELDELVKKVEEISKSSKTPLKKKRPQSVASEEKGNNYADL